MLTYRIKHITRYSYPSPVIDSANQVMLFPLDDEQQEVKKHQLVITHQPEVEVFTDYFGNKVGFLSHQAAYRAHYTVGDRSDNP